MITVGSVGRTKWNEVKRSNLLFSFFTDSWKRSPQNGFPLKRNRSPVWRWQWSSPEARQVTAGSSRPPLPPFPVRWAHSRWSRPQCRRLCSRLAGEAAQVEHLQPTWQGLPEVQPPARRVCSLWASMVRRRSSARTERLSSEGCQGSLFLAPILRL